LKAASVDCFKLKLSHTWCFTPYASLRVRRPPSTN